MEQKKAHSYVFLVNPLSGSGKGVRIAEILERTLPEHPVLGHEASRLVMIDELSPDALRNLIEGSKMLIIAGGDGTVSRLLTTILQCRAPAALGLIPIGTSNDLARAFGDPCCDDAANEHALRARIDRLISAQPLHLDVLSLNGKVFFCNYFSIGFDAVVVRDFDKMRKSRWVNLLPKSRMVNNLMYFLMGVKNARFHLPPPNTVEVEYPGRHERLLFEAPVRAIIATNLPVYAGGCQIHRDASVNDGVFEITVIENLYQYLMLIGTRFIPFIHLPRGVPQYRATRAHIHLKTPSVSQIDGERAEDPLLSDTHVEIAHFGRVHIAV